AEPFECAPDGSGTGVTGTTDGSEVTTVTDPSLSEAVLLIEQTELVVTFTVTVTDPVPPRGATGSMAQVTVVGFPAGVQPPVQERNCVPAGSWSTIDTPLASAVPLLV